MENQNLIPLEGKEIRKTWHNEEWYFVILDVLEMLTETKNPKQYWKDLKKRDPQLEKGGVKISTPLLIDTAGGKQKPLHTCKGFLIFKALYISVLKPLGGQCR